MQSFVDAFYAVHHDMHSLMDGAMSWGVGVLLSKCSKQKPNTKSSLEAEVDGASDFTQCYLEMHVP